MLLKLTVKYAKKAMIYPSYLLQIKLTNQSPINKYTRINGFIYIFIVYVTVSLSYINEKKKKFRDFSSRFYLFRNSSK